MLELIYNKIYILKKANNLRKMPKIKIFIEKNGSGRLKIECTHLEFRVQDFFTM